MNDDKRLFLLDAMALIFRAHFAFIRNPRINSKGQNTSAVFGFMTTLLDIMKKERPTHIGIVYDTDKPTFRHEQFAEYKGTRQARPEDITIAIPYIYQLADAMGIPNLYADGYEADDIIGTLAKKAAAEGYTVYMMTPDKDFAQIVGPNIYQYKPAYMGKPAEIMGVKEILNKWEVNNIEQVIDVLGLMGDSIDNVPGIPGVGEKTAKKLVQEYGSVEGLIEHRAELKGKLKELVEQHQQQALLSKELVTICVDCPIEFDEASLHITPPDAEKIKQLFDELEFKALSSRFFAEFVHPSQRPAQAPEREKQAPLDLFSFAAEASKAEIQEAPLRGLDEVKHDYKLVNTPDGRAALVDLLLSQKMISINVLTSNFNPHDCHVVGFAFAVKPGEAFFVPTSEDDKEREKILEEFRPVFESEAVNKTGQNLKFDIIALGNHKIKLCGELFDTMIAHYLLEPDMNHSMGLIAQQFLSYKPLNVEDIIGKKGKRQLTFEDVPVEKLTDYACEDTDLTLQIRAAEEPMLKKVAAEDLFYKMEMPLVYVLADLEQEGMRIDPEALHNYSDDLQRELEQLEYEIYELAGASFNINSPMQLGDILFDKMQLDPKAKRTQKSKQYATGEEVLAKLAEKHEIAQKILDYRSMQKLKSTYVDALPLLINPRTKRIHTWYNQAVAATGRLSSTDPNLQNIPIRTEKGREIRKAFIPRDDDHVLLSADYSQIELRLIAEISGDEDMFEAFKNNIDIHTATAGKIYSVPLEEVTPEMRRIAKTTNFGIIYGISAFGLSQRLGISRSEAAEVIATYNKQYPRIQQYMERSINKAREHGFVETILGRRRYLRDINSRNAVQRGYAERNAINAPIQGSAADMIKIAMVDIFREFSKRDLKTKMILQVHDELVFDVVKTELETVKEIVEDKMKNALKLKVPIIVEMGTGANWLEAH